MKRTLSFFLLMTLLLSLLVSCTVPGGTAATVTSCEFISEEGGVETWRLTYSDGRTTDMTVRGREAAASLSVTSCEKASTAGLTDTYRITFSDGATADFSVTNGAAGLPGATGAAGTSPTVVSCEKIAESTECATWRLTFSDGATADFTTPVAGGSGDGWQDVLTKVDTLFAALDIKKLPSKTVGNRTVTDGGAANTTENLLLLYQVQPTLNYLPFYKNNMV